MRVFHLVFWDPNEKPADNISQDGVGVPDNHQGPFNKHVLALTVAWISEHINYNVWYEITYTISNFIGCTI